MQNEKAAKLVLSTILEQEVIELQLEQQEVVGTDIKRDLRLFRLDFKATILDADGNSHKVLIELQKSKYSTDIRRFRNYLASGYSEVQSKVKDREGEDEDFDDEEQLPIIAIYILGYKLKEVPHLAVRAFPQIIDSVSKELLSIDSEFIKLLTHQTYILQARRLPEHRRTKLERFMMFFNQAWVADKNYYIDMHDIPEEFSNIADILHTPVADEKFRQQLELEREMDKIFEEQQRKYELKIEEALLEKEEAQQREAEERKQKEEALKKAEETNSRLLATARMMRQAGIPANDIAQTTGLPLEEIEKL